MEAKAIQQQNMG